MSQQESVTRELRSWINRAAFFAEKAPYQGSSVVLVSDLLIKIAELEQARASLQGGAKCIWRETEEMWEADCGAAWTFNDGGPKENSMKHCHVCGKEIEVAACHARKEG